MSGGSNQGSLSQRGLLGLHIRRTDALDLRANAYRLDTDSVSELDAELREAFLAEWETGGYDAAALACDDAATAEAWLGWLRELGVEVVFLEKDWNPEALRQTSLEEAAADLFLLARCRKILASIGGSFSWMAGEIGGVPVKGVSGGAAKASVDAGVNPVSPVNPVPEKPEKLTMPRRAEKSQAAELELERRVGNMLKDADDEMGMLVRLHQWREKLRGEHAGCLFPESGGTPDDRGAGRRFVALCIPCGNRLGHLRETLPGTLAVARAAGDAVVVVAEFACRQGTADWLRAEFPEDIAAGNLAVVKVSGETQFRAGRAKAVAHAVGCEHADYLMNLDADNFFTAEDLAELRLAASQHQNFIAQQYLRSWDCFGRLFLPVSVYRKCGGYHATLGCYGFDDRGLIRNAVGIAGAAFLPISLHSPPPVAHGDGSRREAFPGYQQDEEHKKHLERARLEFEAQPWAPLEGMEAELTDAAGTRVVRLRWDGLF